MLVDPHTAVGLAAARARRALRRRADGVRLATAHPAKFPDAVERATGIRPPLPERLADLLRPRGALRRPADRPRGLQRHVEASPPREASDCTLRGRPASGRGFSGGPSRLPDSAHEVRGVRARRLRRRAGRRARRAHAARGGVDAHAGPAGGPGRGRPGRRHPRRACRPAATSATCRSSATTRPASTPAGRRSRPPPSACGCGRTRSPTAATSSPSATTARWSTSPAAIPDARPPRR